MAANIQHVFKYGTGIIGSAFFSIITVPLLTRITTPADYGRGTLYFVVLNLAYVFLSLGLDQAFSRFYYEKEQTVANRASALWTIMTIIGLAILVMALVVNVPVLRRYFFFLFGVGASQILLYLLVGVLLFTLNRFLILDLRMGQRSGAYSANLIIAGAGNLFFVLFFHYVLGVTGALLIVSARFYSIILATFSALIFQFSLCRIMLKFKFLSREELKAYIAFGLPFVASFILIWGLQNFDRFLIIHFGDFTQLGIYASAFTLITPLVLLQGVFCTMWLPILNKKLVEAPEQLPSLLGRVFHLLLIALIFVTLLVISFKHIIVLMLGKKYIGAESVFVWLLLIPVFYMLAEVTQAGMVLKKKSSINVWSSLFAVVINAVLCLLLIPKYGAIGAAISGSSGYAAYFFIKTKLSMRYLSFSALNLRFCFNMLILVACIYLVGQHSIIFSLIGIMLLCAGNFNYVLTTYKQIYA